ncbi:helix-turn-helix transcriptional regulator [Natrialba sp. SSL1]|uniref:helix-turn-helix transcriptional regulator n=1 Tax=Natrialba sp. SSL1 TaxID=1869245 RepID=UPI0008F8F3FC|nr:helix-turn-helix transcriptional regulator [Natrialba sp. SSL1]OIB56593.1 hypothetical protein BBD46_17255 [Natrialba sp. SSL1]
MEDLKVIRETVLKDYYETAIQHGRLYPNLDSLVDKGLIEKRQANVAQPSGQLSERSAGLEEVFPTSDCREV